MAVHFFPWGDFGPRVRQSRAIGNGKRNRAFMRCPNWTANGHDSSEIFLSQNSIGNPAVRITLIFSRIGTNRPGSGSVKERNNELGTNGCRPLVPPRPDVRGGAGAGVRVPHLPASRGRGRR